MKHFSLKELTKTSYEVNNRPGPQEIKNLNKLVDNILDPIRERYGFSIFINSGYRCKELNEMVGGSPTSQHVTGDAADITVRSKLSNEILFNMIVDMINKGEITVGQLIDEKNYSWIHISNPYRKVNQILHLK